MRFFGFHVSTFSQLFNPSIYVKPLFEGQDGMVELDYVSDQKHLTAMNSMTVG